MNIAFIPIDNRPVCYTLPSQIAEICDNIKFFIPKRELLGDLNKCANIERIIDWLKKLPKIDAIVLSLDTVAYGGLIPSRRSSDTFDTIKSRVEKLKEILEKKHAKIYAFSSIMRISNNNINQEEKTYWDKCGKKIFNYSYAMHKFGSTPVKDIPDEILNDYTETRRRNFEINKLYLNWQKEGMFETLVFSKDDCAEYGFNVQEAQEIERLGGFVKTGADEIPLSLLARAVNENITDKESLQHERSTAQNYKRAVKMKVAPIFLEPEHKHLISNYEDISIEKSVSAQLELAGCEITQPDKADILLYVNNFENKQGEIVMKVPTSPFSGKWIKPDKPYIIADVRYANGADNAFVKQLFNAGFDKNFYGYSAWNTSANSLGSLICAATMMFRNYSPNQFLKLQVIRFLDDWAYQANIRQMLNKPDIEKAKKLMEQYEKIVFKKLNVEYNIKYSFPWNRLFEVEIELI